MLRSTLFAASRYSRQFAWTRTFRTSRPELNRYNRFANSRTPPKDRLDPRQWDTPTKIGAAIVVLGGGYYIGHLEQVSETGRWRFMNISRNQEKLIGEMTKKQIQQEYGRHILPPNHPLSVHVRRITSRILRHSNLGRISGEAPSPSAAAASSFGFGDPWAPDDNNHHFGTAAAAAREPETEWDVVVINDNKIVNAMASPGIIAVFTGILPVCGDEQGLAAVLSHEISHVLARHVPENISSQMVIFALSILLQGLGLDWFSTSLVQTYLLELPNSRTQELEADLIGLRLMSRACYDPAAAPQMFTRLGQIESEMGKQSNIDFFRTHPTSNRRVKELTAALPDAYAILAANPDCAAMKEEYERFREDVRGIRVRESGEVEFV